MEESQLVKTQAKTQCPFCEASFRSVGKHLKHCKKRDGRPYDMFLSCSTTKRPSKPKASTQIEQQCPKCSKTFQRLDLHLRRSATCSPTAQTGKMNPAQQSQQQQHSGLAEDTQSQSHITPSLNTFQLSDLPGFTPLFITTRRPIKMPRAKDKQIWQEVNTQIAREITPTVFTAKSVEDKCEALTEGIYHLLAERCSLFSPQARKTGSQHGAHNRALKRLRKRKRELKKEFREAKKRNAPKEIIAELAKQYHDGVRMHSKSTHEKRQRDEKKKASTIRLECTRNFWKFSSRLLEEENDVNNVQPTCSAEEAHAFFSAEYASSNHTFSRPEWMPPAPEPQHRFHCDEILEEELRRALKRARSGSSPSPKDQVPY